MPVANQRHRSRPAVAADFDVAVIVWNHGSVRPAPLLLTSRRHIDLQRVAGAGC
ncbi:putative leader peptide [Jatrophihabitans lederbergiae]|uniref:putative leader peptide n=1 Tax=Jatrophihabitans lederbergiae TaxID=3075547 RepID=UPI0037C17420